MVIVNTQWNQHRSSGKGKLKLVMITFINRHFLVKKRGCCWWKNCYFCLMLARRVLSLHCFTHCCSVPPNYARIRPLDISFSQIVEIVVNCKSNKNSRGAAGITCVIWGWIRNIKITPLSAWYFFQFRRPVTKILKMSPPVNTRLKLCSWK